MSEQDDEHRLGTWKLICLQLHRFQRAMAADRQERQAASATRRSECAVRSYKAQQLANED
ncbi:MAG: hypothetical protein ACXW2U_05365 [Telluria sp.]